MIYVVIATNDREQTQKAILTLHDRVKPGFEVALLGHHPAHRYKGVKIRCAEVKEPGQAVEFLTKIGKEQARLCDVEALCQGLSDFSEPLIGDEEVEFITNEQETFARRAKEGTLSLEDLRKNGMPPFASENKREDFIEGFAMDSDIGFAVAYFNVTGAEKPRENFLKFLDRMKPIQDRMVVVEAYFNQQTPFLHEHAENVIQLQTSSVIWHKEAMLNIGCEVLRENGFKNVGWLDGDVRPVQSMDEWMSAVRKAMAENDFIQVFNKAVQKYDDHDTEGRGVIAMYQEEDRKPFECFRTGLGFAVKGEIFDECRWYDWGLLGSGDRLMWLALFEEETWGKPIDQVAQFLDPGLQLPVFRQWGERWREKVKKIGFAKGIDFIADAHGCHEDRQYYSREVMLNERGFDPYVHIQRDNNGLFEWTDKAPRELVDGCIEYFLTRKDDYLIPDEQSS